ncbi:CPBP family intramembrane glutamic endopeptidase [Leifsonia sp. Leaf264]|uniref:CPBP family intramembrane glutamic endopeptidase n=1 Tax=Leifsonia sp. Leaf264 TaxID=1736314 RepID=UPI00138ED308|nr:type II CAAX endopeptidase family protein [Leifsonia sp. Leaf264]
MTTDETPALPAATRASQWGGGPGVGWAASGVVLAVLGVLGYERLILLVPIDWRVQALSSYLVVWIPLVAVALIALRLRGSGSLVHDLGLRFTWLDLLWGAGVGLLLRLVATLVEIAVYGSSLAGVSIGTDAAPEPWFIFAAVIAPVLISPVIEEAYFRGFTQRAVERASRSRWTAIIVTALVFAALHLVEANSLRSAIVLGVSTLLFGAAAGALASYTGRIGGAIVAHIVFNGTLVALLYS